MISEDNNDYVVNDDDGGIYQSQQPLTVEKVWLTFRETDKKFRETREEIRETGRILRNMTKEFGGK